MRAYMSDFRKISRARRS